MLAIELGLGLIYNYIDRGVRVKLIISLLVRVTVRVRALLQDTDTHLAPPLQIPQTPQKNGGDPSTL